RSENGERGRANVGPLLVNGLAAFLVRLRQKTSTLSEVVGSRMTLSFACLFPLQVALLYGFFDSFFSALVHKEIIPLAKVGVAENTDRQIAGFRIQSN